MFDKTNFQKFHLQTYLKMRQNGYRRVLGYQQREPNEDHRGEDKDCGR
jgi:hypothetical protein